MSKTVSAAAIGLVMFAMPSFAHDQAEAQKAVDSFLANYVKLWNAKDAAGCAALFAADGVEVGPAPIVMGRGDLEKRFRAIFASGSTDLRAEAKQVQADGNTVFMVGQFTVKAKDGGSVNGNIVNIYEWDGDALKYRVHSFNIMPPPPK
jgi:uncharacterized protein (TIGR02246 family)